MRTRALLVVLLLAPVCAFAQGPVQAPFNAPTTTVLLANRPAHIPQGDWLRMMEQPVTRSLYPLRITQATLDTLDGSALDRRFNYIMGQVDQK